MANNNTGRIEAVERSLRIIDAVQELNGARVTELADYLDLSPSTVHGHLKTLEHHRYLIKEGDVYHIGLEFLNRGGFARNRNTAYTMAFDLVSELANTTEERAQFIVEEHGRGIYLHTVTGNHAVQVNARIGRQNYLHASAAGKAILAHLPESRVNEIIDRWGLKQITENTITDREALFEELEAIREQGISYNQEESVEDLRAVGVPVLDANDHIVGAFSVSGPSRRLEGDRFQNEIPNLLLGAANELKLNIAYD